VLPEFAAVIPHAEREVAARVLLAPILSARDADLGDLLGSRVSDAFDFLIISGVVFKETTLLARSALELLGPGDVLAPPLTALRQLESRAVSRYMAHGSVAIAPLDDRFRRATRRWPGLADVLHDRLGEQTHRASMHLAMLHLPRVEDRVIALFADLGERFGHMTTDGILISIGLTHDAIGRLVGSRRPTVSLALQALADDGRLARLEGDRWRLAPSAISRENG
jgi:CRP/FNR family transcriptional regulator, cyclic AMP receptor protein